MENNTVIGRREYEEHGKMCNERFKRDAARLDKAEAKLERYDAELDEVRQLSVQMGEMIKRHDTLIASHEKRLATLEQQPVESYGKIKIAIITTAIGAIVGFILNGVLNIVK